jgi:hypothetical protein
MSNPILTTTTSRTIERLIKSVWVRVKLADISEGDTFRLTDAVHMNVYKAASDPYLDDGVWAIRIE